MDECKSFIAKQINKSCKACKEGYMIATGEAFMVNPPQYIHVCNKCGYQTKYRGEWFPHTEFEEW